MTRFLSAALTLTFLLGLSGLGRAADAKDATALLDKAIKALGGEAKLSQVKAAAWKTKGTIAFGGNDSEVATQTTVQGLDHLRQEFEGDFGGNKVKGLTVLAGDKGWRKFGDDGTELDKDAVANLKQ